MMYQLKSSYNGPFKDSYSHPFHTHFAMIASNEYLVFSGYCFGRFTFTMQYNTSCFTRNRFIRLNPGLRKALQFNKRLFMSETFKTLTPIKLLSAVLP